MCVSLYQTQIFQHPQHLGFMFACLLTAANVFDKTTALRLVWLVVSKRAPVVRVVVDEGGDDGGDDNINDSGW